MQHIKATVKASSEKLHCLFTKYICQFCEKMSSLRAFRIQKAKPITSSPSSTATSEGGGFASPGSTPDTSVKRLGLDEPSSAPSSQENGSNGNSAHDDSTDDIIRPPVSAI